MEAAQSGYENEGSASICLSVETFVTESAYGSSNFSFLFSFWQKPKIGLQSSKFYFYISLFRIHTYVRRYVYGYFREQNFLTKTNGPSYASLFSRFTKNEKLFFTYVRTYVIFTFLSMHKKFQCCFLSCIKL